MIRRVAAAVIILGVAVVLLVIAWPQLFDLQQSQYVVQLVSFRALAGAAALLVAVVLLVLAAVRSTTRRFTASLAAVLLAFVAVEGIVLLSRGFGGGGSRSTDGAVTDAVTVLAWNTEGDSPSADDIARLAVDAGADVVSLPETSLALASRIADVMAAEGHPMQVLQASTGDGSDVTTALLLSDDLGEYALDRSRGDTSRLPTVIAVPVGHTGPTIVSAHPIAPLPRYLDLWRRDLSWIEGLCASGSVIMAGDFNSTTDHWAAPSATDEGGLGGCRDAATVAGSGAVGTWPSLLPPLLASPIDHVVATADWDVVDAYVVPGVEDLGSDHRPIVAVLRADDAESSTSPTGTSEEWEDGA